MYLYLLAAMSLLYLLCIQNTALGCNVVSENTPLSSNCFHGLFHLAQPHCPAVSMQPTMVGGVLKASKHQLSYTVVIFFAHSD